VATGYESRGVAAGPGVPFAAVSADGGRTWRESMLPAPPGPAVVTALTAAGHGFVAVGPTRPPPRPGLLCRGSSDGRAWKYAGLAGRGLPGPFVMQINALSAENGTLTGAGFAAGTAAEHPVLWHARYRRPRGGAAQPAAGPKMSSRRCSRLGSTARTCLISAPSRSATATPANGPWSARTVPIGSISMLRPTPVGAVVGGAERSGTWQAAATQTVFSIARARTRVTQCSSLNSPAAHAAGITITSAPRTARALASSGNLTS